jgi:hypothetical protein
MTTHSKTFRVAVTNEIKGFENTLNALSFLLKCTKKSKSSPRNLRKTSRNQVLDQPLQFVLGL